MLTKFNTCIPNSPLMFWNFPTKDIQKLTSYFKNFSAYSAVKSSNDDITSSHSNNDNWKKKIIYNEVSHIEDKIARIKLWKENLAHKQEYLNSSKSSLKPLFLQCMEHNKEEVKTEDDSISQSIVQFPFDAQKKKALLIENQSLNECVDDDCTTDIALKRDEYDTKLNRFNKKHIKFENPLFWQDEEIIEELDFSQFGSNDPDMPVSSVPCGGCGALLHCKDTAIPGFVPLEIFQNLTDTDLRGITCQRCLFLKEYNIALGINVNPDEYPKILKEIKKKKALVLLLVDLLDFPCSIWPEITNVIGNNKPLFVVGNKIDLIIQDKEENFIKHRKKCLVNALEDIGINPANIRHVALISAKTGYGVENLITNLHNQWGSEGDIFIVGCTNVGKSTLFNILIQSDFCKSKATDVLQRATVSQWPGTTLNLLKFPILKPLAWRRAVRSQRLKVTQKQMKALKELETSALRNRGSLTQTSLMGYIGKSFQRQRSASNQIGLDPNDPEFRNGKWCYDTPGVIHESQILNLFTTEELAKVLPRKTIIPRNFKLIQGNALFIGGIARLDLITTTTFVWFTVFASADLPVTVTNIEDADLVYEKLIGTHMFAVPQGGKRLKNWPELKSKNIRVNGIYENAAAADIVLSSAGWIAITLAVGQFCNLCAWTPDRRGIFVRDTPLIKYSSSYRGKKIRGTPAYYPGVEVVENIKFVK